MAKCKICSKKLVLTMTCKCEGQFCMKHRDPEMHGCTFDFVAAAKKEIEEKNPKVVVSKVEPI
jgi:predicted nucleic acid binding AN1-type Zn finger protein